MPPRDLPEPLDAVPRLPLDTSLPSALAHLVHHLVDPLARHYPQHTTQYLLEQLKRDLFRHFQPTWDEAHPQVGSGTRSLICTRHLGLPMPMRGAGTRSGVEERVWRKAIAEEGGRSGDVNMGEEWEVWCDPGQVVWRWGPWEWEDPEFEPSKIVRESLQVIWQSAADGDKLSPTTPAKTAQGTPSRPSYAVPIRAPTLLAIPPTPSRGQGQNEAIAVQESLLPAFSTLGLGRPSDGGQNRVSSGWSSSEEASSRSTSMTYSEEQPASPEHRSASRTSHRGSESQSSISSSVSDSNSGHTQLLTPATRPSTADPFTVSIVPLRESFRQESVDVFGDRESSEKLKTTPISQSRGRASPNALCESNVQPATPTTENTITPRVPTPTVTPYDGGNVTVLGGGIKLGGGAGSHSRSSSVQSSHRTPIDRTRSPSVSFASRALSSATGPNGEPRKQRTRRRIMPTYLGHLGQPGVGGPVMGAFNGVVSPGTSGGMGYGFGAHVGVGVSPPQVGIRGPMPRMGH
ncbi:hypothetical protein L198_04345 [Cryptococcus wingfieldii CBS 7118]|uniref:Anti-proliferative protein domain-containing protein n=1 Tax=Cryptococcus wingfieldii CBS 7118 TaxID=1295528 RepID=A0A1E3J4G1_9TREE|nr:hypothetical protein L198_04345 [Cryptococcus wingfieldii CBS 7118]ODN95727.1 hypothetical protein L198_04345 [Cryptococcus wingfieldii CBS 7118]